MTRYTYEDLISGIVNTGLRGYGENRMTNCPLHVDRSPSLSINLDKGVFLCFSCGERGGLERLGEMFQTPLTDEDRIEVAQHIAERLDEGTEPPVDLYPVLRSLDYRPSPTSAAPFFEYLNRKRLGRAVVEHFRLGWSHERGAIAEPYFDDDVPVAVKFRYPDGRQQFASGSRRSIYNVDEVRGTPTVVICEGESDTHVMWQALRDSGAGVGGIPGAQSRREAWELRALDLLFAKDIYIAFDNDPAGESGAQTALQVLGDRAHRMAPPPNFKDWSDAIVHGGVRITYIGGAP